MSRERSEASELERFVAALPKVELHVHLEGSIRPATLLRLARRRRVDLPASSEAGLAEWLRFRDFDHFIEAYLLASRCLRDPEDFQLVIDEFLAEQARQKILYSEAHFTISTHVANGANAAEVADAMAESIAAGERRWGTRLRLIPDIVRNAEYSRADLTLEWALANRDRMVVALGISGKESHSSAPFREHFAVAACEGLHRVAHAGEQEGVESIYAALADCQPERLGHGIRAIDDAALVARLREDRIPLEVCPTSNLRLGLAEDYTSHPFGALYRSGLEVSLNSDDPALFGTDLVNEYLAIARAFDLSLDELCALALAPVRHSFLDEDEKSRRLLEFEHAYRDLAETLLDPSLERRFGD